DLARGTAREVAAVAGRLRDSARVAPAGTGLLGSLMAARFLLDSDICVYLLSGRHPNLVRTFDRKLPRQVGVSVIVMGELLAGHDDTRRHFRDPRGAISC